MTSAVAEVTSIRTWEELVLAVYLAAARAAQVRRYIAGLGDHDADSDPRDVDAEQDAAVDLDAERAYQEYLDRLDDDAELDHDAVASSPPDPEPDLDQ